MNRIKALTLLGIIAIIFSAFYFTKHKTPNPGNEAYMTPAQKLANEFKIGDPILKVVDRAIQVGICSLELNEEGQAPKLTVPIPPPSPLISSGQKASSPSPSADALDHFQKPVLTMLPQSGKVRVEANDPKVNAMKEKISQQERGALIVVFCGYEGYIVEFQFEQKIIGKIRSY